MTELFTPTAEEKIESTALTHYICEEIKAQNGLISFNRYMELALYAPQLGYYTGAKPKLGKHGDFTTAPEISPLFSYCLAQQFSEILPHLRHPNILEFGAGSGVMAAQCLLELEKLGLLPNQYLILEISPYLKHLQQETLTHYCPHLLEKVNWIEKLPESSFEGVVIANEVLDAMPVHLFEIKDDQIFERYVSYQQGEFHWQLEKPASHELQNQIAEIKAKYELNNYVSEINLLITPWINSINQFLAKGLVLLIDYGFPQHEYYHWQRHMGTLMCHYRHHAHSNPLILTGIQDITAHVDFSKVQQAALDCGMTIGGFNTQAGFLLGCGLLNYLTGLEDTIQQYELSQQVKKLTLPSEMGELFKVMALTKGIDLSLKGFSLQNRRL